MKKYFRFHRGGYMESMETMVEVNNIEDVRKLVEDVGEGYFKNIHIGDGFEDARCIPYGWGSICYYVLADFDGYTNQCIGYVNFTDNREKENKYNYGI